MMSVSYSGVSGKQSSYLCVRAANTVGLSTPCQRLGGRRLEETVLGAVFEMLAPATLAVTAQALSDVQAKHEQQLLAFEAAVERARYEAQRSRRQFDAVEPENRLVARGLEAEWESRLKELARTEAALAERRSAGRCHSPARRSPGWLARARISAPCSTPTPPRWPSANSCCEPC
jgi:hypothetical protein